ncbi:MAG: aminotransferase class V-fold PLP-dependent enzyme [Acidimicrobiales bacterium]
MSLDLARLRADTPGCEQVAHLNNAGAALSPRPVLEAFVGHIELEARMGGYEAADFAAEAIGAAAASVGRLLGVDPLDIALTQNDTASWAKAFWGLAFGGWFDGGGRVLVDRAAYNSHYLALLQARERFGISIEAVESTEDGSVDLDELDRCLNSDVRMVTATHVGTHRGLVNPVAEVGARTRAAGVPFFLDACQSAGQLVVDLPVIGCDVATGTGRKWLRAPRGTGWLFVAPEWSERMSPPGIDGRSAEWVDASSYELRERARRFEEFETSYAARLGFGAAVDYALDIGIHLIAERIEKLAEELRSGLVASGAAVHDGGTKRSGIVTFTVPGHDCSSVQESLREVGINVSVTRAPWARLDMEQRGVSEAVRASPHAYNSEEEIRQLVEQVAQLVSA